MFVAWADFRRLIVGPIEQNQTISLLRLKPEPDPPLTPTSEFAFAVKSHVIT